MGEPLADFSAKGVSSSSFLCHSTCENPGCEHSCACCKDLEAKVACGQDDLVVKETEAALAEVMHVYDDDGPDLGEDSNEDDDLLLSLDSDSTDELAVDTELVISPAFPSGDASESSIGKQDDGDSSSGTPTLVSAIKGTRAKQGIITKLSVSWAPDVYDPPVTSDSHTVRGHQMSSRKGHYKYKPSKSSSSSSSSSRSTNGSKKDKKHSRHSSSSSNKKDRNHSYRSSSSCISSRTGSSVPQYRNEYSARSSSGSRTDAGVLESTKVSPLVPAESAALPEAVPILKAMEQIKCATSCCKEKPFALLSRQFSPARYKGMFSFWSQNQLAS
ncbi:uncharacterized serine-rich protein C1E8.05-like [Phragmites australis]|uniref:uncharacterized serine-rich protein C1E8.05-like n=1 Tax=Phragmites australis TaxID=29695 RepID=UPI002D7A09B2|nr:uncharacterized serine-rich protein C1E8.05-like [Phragmites australis]